MHPNHILDKEDHIKNRRLTKCPNTHKAYKVSKSHPINENSIKYKNSNCILDNSFGFWILTKAFFLLTSIKILLLHKYILTNFSKKVNIYVKIDFLLKVV